MASLYLRSLNSDQRSHLINRLHETQDGKCFICTKTIDLALHGDSIDIDHVEPLTAGGGR